MLPGDVVTNMSRVPNMTKEAQAALRAQFGIDKPMVEQYGLYLEQLGRGNLGVSYQSQQPVLGEVLHAVGNTIPMVGLGTVVAILVGTLIGVTAAYRQGSARDRVITGSAMIVYSLPVQWVGLLLLVWLAGWLPTSGMSDPYLFDAGLWTTVRDRALHMLLPATCVALMLFGSFALVVRSSQLEALGEDHVLTARAKGASERSVMWKHVFRNALIPIMTGFPAAFVGAFFSSSLLIETLFSLDGLGLLSYESVIRRDYPVVLGSLFFFTMIGLVTTLVRDLSYLWVDQRVKYD